MGKKVPEFIVVSFADYSAHQLREPEDPVFVVIYSCRKRQHLL